MGSSYSDTNISQDCSPFISKDGYTEVRLSDSIMVRMRKSTDGRSEFTRWGLGYIIGDNDCWFELKKFNNHSVELNSVDTADRTIGLRVKIERDVYGGLVCDVQSSYSVAQQSNTKKDYKDCSIETTIISYSCSQREGLYVVEKKKNTKNENPHLVNLAHYYINQDVGLSVVASVHGFWVDVKGPYKHPPQDLRMVLLQTRRRLVWTPTACPHCRPTQQYKQNDSVSSFSPQFLINNHGKNDGIGNGSVIVAKELKINGDVAAESEEEKLNLRTILVSVGCWFKSKLEN